jgi:hypothetical protein
MPSQRNLQNQIFDRLAGSRLGVVSVRGEHPLADLEEADPDPQMRARCPALSVAPSEWRTTVGDLVQRASWLVCEVWSDTTGITDELSMSRRLRRADDTVVLLPRPQHDHIRRYESFDGFWRMALYGDLETTPLFSHPCTRALDLMSPDLPVDTTPSEPSADSGTASMRSGIPIVIPDLVAMASRYVEANGDWGSAAVHAQNAWNIGVRLAELNAPFSLRELDALVRGAGLLAERLVQFNRIPDALAKLDVALVLASKPELRHYTPWLKQLRQQIASLTVASAESNPAIDAEQADPPDGARRRGRRRRGR